MSALTPQGTSQTAASPGPPQTAAPSPPTAAPPGPLQTVAPPLPPQTAAPPLPPQTAAPPLPPQTAAPSDPPQTAAPSDPPQMAAPSEPLLTAATAETPLPAHTAHSQSKSRKKKGRSKKKARVADTGSEMATSDDDASEERKPGPGRKSPLTQQQQGLVRARFSEWEDILRENELHLGKKDAHARDPEAVTLWVEKAINEITTSPEFGTFNDTSKELNRILKDMFRNYRNNTFIKKNKHAFIQKAITKDKKVLLDSTDADLSEGDGLKADAQKAAEALASFKNPAPAKAIFREENDDKIKEEAERLRAEAAQQRAAEGRDPEDFDSRRDDNRGGFYQRALSALWKQADQTLYEEKANSFDLYTNQEEFPKVIRTALESLCQHGALGPMEIFFMSGFRNANNEVTLCRMTCHHNDGENQPGFLRSKGEEGESAMITRRWYDYCNAYLPKHDVAEPSIAASTYVTTNEDGTPVLVNFNLRELKPSQLCEVLKTFLSTLWFHSWPRDQERSSIPLLEIIQHPDDFYDTEKYQFPVAFAEIETLHPADLYTLADYLLSRSGVSCPHPFVFRSKQDICKCLASRRRLQALELSTGEDIAPYDAIHAQLTPSDHSISLPTSNPVHSTVNKLPAANNDHQTPTLSPVQIPATAPMLSPVQIPATAPPLSPVPIPGTALTSSPATAPPLSPVPIPGTALTSSPAPPSTERIPFTKPMPSTEPTCSGELIPSTVSDITPVSVPMDTTPQDIPSVSTNFMAPVLSDNAVPAGQISPPSSSAAPVSTLQHAPLDAAEDPNSPNSMNSTPTQNPPSSVVITLPDAAIPDSSNIAPPVAASVAQPTRQSRRGARKKNVASKGSTPGSSHPVNATAVQAEVHRSSRGKAGKRANPVPDPCQRPAKKPKQHHKGYVNLVPQPDGRDALVHADGTISGYVIKDPDGKEIVVDEDGQFVRPLFGNAE
ncbi:hypothetical protein EV360DRAFT_85457 [Lentinula raphanica]|nr:hypothetical protein EV360DRAFT_85457 [Lentinula raphanica]